MIFSSVNFFIAAAEAKKNTPHINMNKYFFPDMLSATSVPVNKIEQYTVDHLAQINILMVDMTIK